MSFNGNEGEAIPLETAKEWTATYRATKEENEPNAVFFGREKLQQILDQADCMGIRIYFGVNDEQEKALILVGAEADEDDQLKGLVLDRGAICPPRCPTGGGLNG